MGQRYRDADLISALPYARGFDRELLICALGYSEGEGGEAELRRLFETENGHNRSAAVASLALRVGAASTPVLVQALHTTSAQLQESAARLLAKFGDASDSAELLGWVDRRLGRKNRSRTWDPTELPTGIIFAARHGQLSEVAAVITRRWSNLEDDEHEWLRTTWPGPFTDDGSPGNTPREGPLPAGLQGSIYQDLRGNARGEPLWGFEAIDEALTRARRRAARASASN